MDEADRLEQLKKRLNRRGVFKPPTARPSFSRPHMEVSEDWQHPDSNEVEPGRDRNNFLKKIFIFSVIFFILVVLAAVYIVKSGSNVVSSGNIDIVVQGPVSVKGGEELSLNLVVANNNTVDLESADLIVKFPDGTRSAENIEVDMLRYRNNLGLLKVGETHNENIKAIMFGEANKEQVIEILLEYRTSGSNAIFVKEKDYEIIVTSSPLEVAVTAPEEVRSDTPIEVEIEISSNATEDLKDILTHVNYPGGFRFERAVPSPTYGNNVWSHGDVSSARSRTITIYGVMEGQDEEKKLFRVTSGVRSAEREDRIGVPYGTTFETTLVKKSFIDLDFTIGGRRGNDFVANAGQELDVNVLWGNNLPEKLLNGKMIVTFTGELLDKSEVEIGPGFYNSTDNTITIDQRHSNGLVIIEPGATGQVNFKFASLKMNDLVKKGIVNPEIGVEVMFTGTRVLDGKPGETVTAELSRLVRVNSRPTIAARGVRSSTVGPFVNTGPIPPRAGQESTYTVIWSLSNTVNALADVEVTASLPSYVKWLGVVSPVTEKMNYNQVDGEVKWDVGSVGSSASASPVREVAFQIALQPSISQVGTQPILISDIEMNAADTFTQVILSDTAPDINTRIDTDPTYKEKDGIVTQ